MDWLTTLDSLELPQFLRILPNIYAYRYSDRVHNVIFRRLFVACGAANPEYLHLFFPHGRPLDDENIKWSLKEAQGAVEGAEYTEGARGTACGHIFRPGEASYHCRTCTSDPTCVLCARCFDASDHEGHPVYIHASDGNSGCCDCGDVEAWNRPVHCSIHSEDLDAMLTSTSLDMVQPQLPDELVAMIRTTIARCFDFLCDIWSCSPEQLRANKSTESIVEDERNSKLASDVYGGPDVSSGDGKPGIEYALVLWNDEKHTVTDVRDSLARACRIPTAAGLQFAEEIDRVGRSVVKYDTNLQTLTDAARILEQPKLSVTIRSSRDIFREQMCGTIVEWIMDISGCSIGGDGKLLKQIICEELTQEWRVGSLAHHKMVGQDGIYDHDREEVKKDIHEALGTWGHGLLERLEQAWGTISGRDDPTEDDASDGPSQIDDSDDMQFDPPPPGAYPESTNASTTSIIVPQSERGADTELSDETDGQETLLAVPRTPSAAKHKKAPRPPQYWRDMPLSCSVSSDVMPDENLRRRVRLDWLILYDLRMWKQLRINLREVFISTLITMPRFKRILALRFASVFTVLAELHLIADREPDHSLICLSLQLLTVPSITTEVVERGNFLTNLMAIIYTFLSTRQVGYPHQVDLTATLAIDQGVVFNRRAQTFYQDMRNMLSLDVVREKIRIEPRYLLQFLDIAKIHQGICPNVRAIGEHVEYEMESWMSLSSVMNEIMRLCRSFSESFHLQTAGHQQFLEAALRTSAAVAIINSLGCEMGRFEQGEVKQLARFHNLGPFEFDHRHVAPYWTVRFVVAEEPLSCYHPLHYMVSWLLNESRSYNTERIREVFHFSEDDLRGYATSKQALTKLSVIGNFPTNYLMVLFDYPIRVCAWMAQTKAGMWVRNGLSLRHQIQQYRSVSRREYTCQRDIFLIQTSLVVCEPAAMLATIIDRFDLVEWVKGNYEAHPAREEPQTIEMAEEFIHLLIVILCDRLNLIDEPREKVSEMTTRRELLHALCSKPLSFAELRKYLTEKVKEADDQGILQQMTTFKAPEGMTDHGTFTLKEQYYEEIDPYLPFLSRNQREEAEMAYRKHMAKKTGKDINDVVYEPTILPIKSGLFKDIHQFTNTPLFAQTIFYFIQYAMMAPTLAPDVQTTKIEQLFQFVLHLTLVAIILDDATEPDFPELAESMDIDDPTEEANAPPKLISFSRMVIEKKATRIVSSDTIAGMLRRSMELEHLKSCAPRIKTILRRLQQKRPVEYRAWVSTLDTPLDFELSTPNSNHAVRETKKKQALERQARVMAQFKQQQASFIKNHDIDWGEDMDDLDDDDLTVTGHETVARFPSGSCILCQEETDEHRLFGTFGLVMDSTVFRNTPTYDLDWVLEVFDLPESLDEALPERPFGVASKNRRLVRKVGAEGGVIQNERQDLAKGFPSACVSPGPVSVGCGHIMHFTCYEVYVSATARRHVQQIARHHPENIDRHEFLCPLCKALGNTFLPIIWKPQPLTYPGPLAKSEEYSGNTVLDPSPDFGPPTSDRLSLDAWNYDNRVSKYSQTKFISTLASQIQPTATTSNLDMVDFSPPVPGFRIIQPESETETFSSILESLTGISPPAVTTNSSVGSPIIAATTLAGLGKVYQNLSKSVKAAGLEELHRSDGSDGAVYDALIQSLAGSIKSVEVAQRGIASPTTATFIEKISSQSITHLRVMSETITSYLSVFYLLSRQPHILKTVEYNKFRRISTALFIGEHTQQCQREREAANLSELDPCSEQCMHHIQPLLSEDPFYVLCELSFCAPDDMKQDIKRFLMLFYTLELVRVIWVYSWQEATSAIISETSFTSDNRVKASSEVQVPPAFHQFVTLVCSYDDMSLRNNDATHIAKLYTLCKKYALPFLRSCALLMHIRYGIDFPTHTHTGSELDRLSQLLYLPLFDELLAEITSTPGARSIIQSWTQHWWLASNKQDGRSVQLSHPAPFELIGLPRNFDTLQDEVMRRKCPSTGRALWDPAICLFCGEIFCSQSVCCTRPEQSDTSGARKTGGCWQHREKCGGRIGIFLHIRKCTVVYLHGGSGSFTVAPYLDKFGEADPSLRSNLQLFLNQKRYDAIFKNAWLTHQVPSMIARKLEGESNTGGWETL